ncbi:MAG TPA: hypothetical protein PKI03_33200 [Pseudomonadota bacterium]|nr:hypothetical protein [Pseudomonadota bacterium]
MKTRAALLFSSLLGLFVSADLPLARGEGDPLSLTRRDEGRLLNQALSPMHLSSNLRVLDNRSDGWLTTLMSDPPATRVLVVHLFTTAQAADMGWLREAGRRIEANYGGDVRFLFVSESVSGTDVKRTLGPATLEIRRPTVAGQPPITPFPIYLDANAALAESLRPALLGGELHLPMTLLVDSEFVIRYAMVGGISARRSELSSAIADLLRQAPRKRNPGTPALEGEGASAAPILGPKTAKRN